MDLPFAPPGGPVGPDELAEIARCVAEHARLWEDDLDPDRSTRTYNEVFTSAGRTPDMGDTGGGAHHMFAIRDRCVVLAPGYAGG